MNNINIRKSNINDLKSIQELNNELFKLEYNNFDSDLIISWPFEEKGKNYFIDMIKNKIVFVAEIDNNIVGYLAGRTDIKLSYVSKKTAELDNMCVSNKYKRLGIGKMLISNFKKECKENHVENILVTASIKNANAIEFYKKQVFEDDALTLKIKI